MFLINKKMRSKSLNFNFQRILTEIVENFASPDKRQINFAARCKKKKDDIPRRYEICSCDSAASRSRWKTIDSKSPIDFDIPRRFTIVDSSRGTRGIPRRHSCKCRSLSKTKRRAESRLVSKSTAKSPRVTTRRGMRVRPKASLK